MSQGNQEMLTRCGWCGEDSLYQHYHDNEWGVPLHDDQTLFEFLLLEGAQAGLSWITVLKKRESYRLAFDHFDANKIARYGLREQELLLQNPNIIRNKLKIAAFIKNAQAYIKICETQKSFDDFIWQFTDHKTIQNSWGQLNDIPTFTKQSESMNKALKKAGFSFVGPTICYAFMQATGMVNDHVKDCFRHEQLR